MGRLASAGTVAWSSASDQPLPVFDRRARHGGSAVPQDCADRFAKWPAFIPRAGTFDAELDARRSNVAAQRRRLQLTEMSYRSGSSDYLGVLTARTELYSAEIALIAVQQQRLAPMTGLYRALGGGWIERSGDSPPHAVPGTYIPLTQAQKHPRTPG